MLVYAWYIYDLFSVLRLKSSLNHRNIHWHHDKKIRVSGFPNMCKHQQNQQWYILLDHNNYAGMCLIYPWPTFSTKTHVFTQSQKYPQAWQENMVLGYPNISKHQQNHQWYILIDHNSYAGMCLIYAWPIFSTKTQVFTQSQKYPQVPWQENMAWGYPNMCKH